MIYIMCQFIDNNNIFIAVPKCGCSYICNNLKNLPVPILNDKLNNINIKLKGGHFGIYPLIKNNIDITNITSHMIFRDPIEWYVSLYYYVKDNEDHPWQIYAKQDFKYFFNNLIDMTTNNINIEAHLKKHVNNKLNNKPFFVEYKPFEEVLNDINNLKYLDNHPDLNILLSKRNIKEGAYTYWILAMISKINPVLLFSYNEETIISNLDKYIINNLKIYDFNKINTLLKNFRVKPDNIIQNSTIHKRKLSYMQYYDKEMLQKIKIHHTLLYKILEKFQINNSYANTILNTNAIWGQVDQPMTSNNKITYLGDYHTFREIDTTKYSDEVLVWHTPKFSKEEWRYGLYGIKTNPTWDYVEEENVLTLELNKPKIIDCFIFYNELDLLNYRLNLLYDIVDYFVLVESTYTHTGNKTELYFNNNKHIYKKFLDKIVHIIVDDVPIQTFRKYSKTILTNEIYHRNAISRGINQLTLKDNDIIIISDLDEIPNPELIINKDNILITEHSIPMDLYWYNLHRIKKNEWLKYAKILTYKKYLKYKDCQEIRTTDLPIINSYKNGWHFSYFGNADFIHNKLNNFSHQENEVQSINNKDEILKRMENGDDLSTYDREWKFNYISILQNNNLPPKYELYLKKYYNSSKIHFITYADENFSKSKARILKEAEEFGEFSTITGYGPEHLDDNFKEKYKDILKEKRGGGYWIWRPYILNKKFQEIDDDDIMIFLDAGCTINHKGKNQFYKYINMFNNTDKGIISFEIHDQIEKKWVTKEIINYFNINLNNQIINTKQLYGGVLIIKKNIHSKQFITKFLKVLNDNPYLFTDIYNTNQIPEFIENRHDQSISSILKKQLNSIIINNYENSIDNPFLTTRLTI